MCNYREEDEKFVRDMLGLKSVKETTENEPTFNYIIIVRCRFLALKDRDHF